MSGTYACCAHCLATGELGTHGNPCGYLGCPGSKHSGRPLHVRVAWLMALAGLLFAAGMIVSRVVTR